jgi:outer membrane biogenesis lipoprotein LolB
MKKRAALLLALAMLATTVLAGCGSKEDKSADNKKEDKKEAKVENDDETLIVGFDASFHMDIRMTMANMSDLTWNLHRKYATETTGSL